MEESHGPVRRSQPTSYSTTSPTSTPPASFESFYPPQHPLDTHQNFPSSPFPSSTFIELSDLPSSTGETESVLIGGNSQSSFGTGGAEIRSRTSGGPDSFTPGGASPSTSRHSRPDRRARREEADYDDKKSRRPNSRQHEEEPIIDEILSILPPEVSGALVKIGKIVYPSLQLLNVRTDIEESGEAYVFNTKPRHFLKNFTAGLTVHALVLAVSLAVFILVELVAPTFFEYPFFFFQGDEIFSYWKLFIWGGILSSVVWYLKGGRVPKVDQGAFVMKAMNGLVVAVVEELGYRWLYICLAMVLVQLFNIFIHYVALWLGLAVIVTSICVGIFAGIGYAGAFKNQASIQRFFAKYNPIYIMLACVIGLLAGVFLVAMGLVYSVVFDAIWDYVIVPVCNFFSAWQFDDMFNGWFGGIAPPPDPRSRWRSRNRKDYWKNAAPNRFFVYGMIVSNLTYRDGHKYQGLVGWINSWYVGLVFLSAMVHHGFFTALFLHLLYELEFIAIGYIFRKYQLSRPSKNTTTATIPM